MALKAVLALLLVFDLACVGAGLLLACYPKTYVALHNRVNHDRSYGFPTWRDPAALQSSLTLRLQVRVIGAMIALAAGAMIVGVSWRLAR